ncbi:MAG: DUF3526 domain-containing protein [Bacteroidota bacterium]
MYRLLFQQFLRTKTCQLGLTLLLILGAISIITGRQFLQDQEKTANQVADKQLEHIKRNVDLHAEDLPLLMYYLKFSLVNEPHPLAGLSIGQKDLHPSVQRVTILTLEGQKYDADLVNPTKLLYGNLDLTFILVYILPLLIIAFNYNLYSEEAESGTWKMVNVMAKSTISFLFTKLLVRFTLLVIASLLLIISGGLIMGVALDGMFWLFTATSIFYIVFWFAMSFWIISMKRGSNFNALTLLSIWLMLVIMLPALINNYVTNQYPVPEAFTTMIKQRDGYHKKWDTGKRETMVAFYQDYPQFKHFGFPPEEGFNWTWYYAMQHLGDVESRSESQAMQDKIRQREAMSRTFARFIPSMHMQLSLSDLAGTGLLQHMDFLSYTNEFHERIRLHFYPKIFANELPETIDWSQFLPEYKRFNGKADWLSALMPLLLAILLLASATIIQFRKS